MQSRMCGGSRVEHGAFLAVHSCTWLHPSWFRSLRLSHLRMWVEAAIPAVNWQKMLKATCLSNASVSTGFIHALGWHSPSLSPPTPHPPVLAKVPIKGTLVPVSRVFHISLHFPHACVYIWNGRAFSSLCWNTLKTPMRLKKCCQPHLCPNHRQPYINSLCFGDLPGMAQRLSSVSLQLWGLESGVCVFFFKWKLILSLECYGQYHNLTRCP